METVHSIKQRKTALLKIAEAMARQWFGYVIYPETWNNQWVVSGLASYASYEMLKSVIASTLSFYYYVFSIYLLQSHWEYTRYV